MLSEARGGGDVLALSFSGTPHYFLPGLSIRHVEQRQQLDRDEFRQTQRHPKRPLGRGIR
jgi:hypothetical protein